MHHIHRFRFSIRGLLFIVAIFCIWLAFYGERAMRQSKAVDEIIANGGLVTFGDSKYFDTGQLRHWFSSVETVTINPSNEHCADDQISIVARLLTIKHLDVRQTSITTVIEGVEYVNRTQTEGCITDTGLSLIVEKLQHLESVEIYVELCSDLAIEKLPSQFTDTKVTVSKRRVRSYPMWDEIPETYVFGQ